MNESDLHDLERRLSASLHASAPHAEPDLADRLLRRTAMVGQRRGFFGLPLSAALAAAAVVVLAVALGLGIGYLIPRQGFVGGPSESPMPSRGSTSTAPPSATPEPSDAPSADPSPSAAGFENANRCTNDEAGYSVDYPADWWANERIVPDPPGTPIAPCVAFAEEPVELIPNSQLPPSVAISGGITEPAPEDATQPMEILSSRQTEVAGRPAAVVETRWTEDVFFFRAGDRLYEYRIELANGQTLLFGTHMNELIDDVTFDRYKEVLDTMMETLELTAS
ncbi:MAG TPA: hypothetical protein VFH79_12460 [Candidatus Limnocylindria bacterium]|nr:hypothetical protein [Candidatus Limnocylindria bacterium]